MIISQSSYTEIHAIPLRTQSILYPFPFFVSMNAVIIHCSLSTAQSMQANLLNAHYNYTSTLIYFSFGVSSARNNVQSNRTRQRILGIIQLNIPLTDRRITDRPRRTRERSNRIIIPRQDLHLPKICANCGGSAIRRRSVRGAGQESEI
jgi:hypothetical protein